VRAAIGDQREFRLLDAQRVIAREYGFAKWSELRAVVQARRKAADATAAEPLSQPLTRRTQIAVAIARGIAAADGHIEAGACHLALGVLREGENPAVAALHRAGVPIRELRHTLERALPAPGVSRHAEASLEASPEELALVRVARHEAIERGVPFVGNEHLFLALLRDQESPISRVLANYGISHAIFSQHLDAVLSGA
jgi:ATP-dependent Clp protease ATP-binding subunit ClpA